MIKVPAPPETDEFPVLDPEKGLQDPRAIHPAPDDVFNDPGKPAADPDDATEEPEPPAREGAYPVAAAPGIIDPRIEPAGPDL